MNTISENLTKLLKEINDAKSTSIHDSDAEFQKCRADYLEKFKPIANQLGDLIKTLSKDGVPNQTVQLATGDLLGDEVCANFIAFNNQSNASFADEQELEDFLNESPSLYLEATLYSMGDEIGERDANLLITISIRGASSIKDIKSSIEIVGDELSKAASGLKYTSVMVFGGDISITEHEPDNFTASIKSAIETIEVHGVDEFDYMGINFKIDENDNEQNTLAAIKAIVSLYCEATLADEKSLQLMKKLSDYKKTNEWLALIGYPNKTNDKNEHFVFNLFEKGNPLKSFKLDVIADETIKAINKTQALKPESMTIKGSSIISHSEAEELDIMYAVFSKEKMIEGDLDSGYLIGTDDWGNKENAITLLPKEMSNFPLSKYEDCNAAIVIY